MSQTLCNYPIRLEHRPNKLAARVRANCGYEANLFPAARRGNRLIGALAAKVVRRSKRHDRLARVSKPLHPDHRIDRRVANDVNHGRRALLRGDPCVPVIAHDPLAIRDALALGRHEVLPRDVI
jgi:hypothetical protein